MRRGVGVPCSGHLWPAQCASPPNPAGWAAACGASRRSWRLVIPPAVRAAWGCSGAICLGLDGRGGPGRVLSSATDLSIPALSGELDLGMGVVSALGFYARGVRRARREAGAVLARPRSPPIWRLRMARRSLFVGWQRVLPLLCGFQSRWTSRLQVLGGAHTAGVMSVVANDGGACGRRILVEGVMVRCSSSLLSAPEETLDPSLPDQTMVALNVTFPAWASSLSFPWLG